MNSDSCFQLTFPFLEQGRTWLVLLIIPFTLVLLWLYNLNLDLEKEAETFPSEFASISSSLQNALLDSAMRIGLEATKAMLLKEEKVGEALGERKVLLT